MPIHDWSKAEASLFHTVHNLWIARLVEYLNGGALPAGYSTYTDTRVDVYEPDTVTVRRRAARAAAGVAVLPAPDRRATARPSRVRRHRLLKVLDDHKRVVAVFEVVSPANKDRGSAVTDFAGKAAAFLASGVNVTVADLLAPGPSDPFGMHPPVWEAVDPEARIDRPPADRPLTFAAYKAGKRAVAHLYYTAVGRPLPDVPLFLGGPLFVTLPLEETYMATVNRLAPDMRESLG